MKSKRLPNVCEKLGCGSCEHIHSCRVTDVDYAGAVNLGSSPCTRVILEQRDELIAPILLQLFVNLRTALAMEAAAFHHRGKPCVTLTAMKALTDTALPLAPPDHRIRQQECHPLSNTQTHRLAESPTFALRDMATENERFTPFPVSHHTGVAL